MDHGSTTINMCTDLRAHYPQSESQTSTVGKHTDQSDQHQEISCQHTNASHSWLVLNKWLNKTRPWVDGITFSSSEWCNYCAPMNSAELKCPECMLYSVVFQAGILELNPLEPAKIFRQSCSFYVKIFRRSFQLLVIRLTHKTKFFRNIDSKWSSMVYMRGFGVREAFHHGITKVEWPGLYWELFFILHSTDQTNKRWLNTCRV